LKRNTNSGRYIINDNEGYRMQREEPNRITKPIGYYETAVKSVANKSKITLSDNEFGKY
jgi:hypothetical protein